MFYYSDISPEGTFSGADGAAGEAGACGGPDYNCKYRKKGLKALMDCDTFLKEHPKAMLFLSLRMGSIMEKHRNLAVSNSDAEVFVCMTQGALPADEYLTQGCARPCFPMKKSRPPMQDNFRKKIAAEWNAIRGSSITWAAVHGQNKGGSF